LSKIETQSLNFGLCILKIYAIKFETRWLVSMKPFPLWFSSIFYCPILSHYGSPLVKLWSHGVASIYWYSKLRKLLPRTAELLGKMVLNNKGWLFLAQGSTQSRNFFASPSNRDTTLWFSRFSILMWTFANSDVALWFSRFAFKKASQRQILEAREPRKHMNTTK